MDLAQWLRDEVETQTFQYRITAGVVPRDRWAERPRPGDSPISWLVWHIARWHDIAVNVMTRGIDPVFDDGWRQRLGIDGKPGTGFADDDVDALAASIDTDALDAYWQSVSGSTLQWLEMCDAAKLSASLQAIVDTDRRLDACGEILPPSAGWVRDLFRGNRGSFFVRWTAIGHGYWHLGEMQTVTTAMGYRSG